MSIAGSGGNPCELGGTHEILYLMYKHKSLVLYTYGIFIICMFYVVWFWHVNDNRLLFFIISDIRNRDLKLEMEIIYW